MFGLKKDEQKIAELLKGKRGDFYFDRAKVKARLMASIEHAPRPAAIARKPYGRWAAEFGVALAVVALLVTGTSYADAAKPGDKLYFLDLLEEKLALTLPRTAASRAQLQSEILSERIDEIDKIEGDDAAAADLKIRSLDAVQRNLVKAVDDAAAAKAKLEQKGKDKSVDKVNRVLDQLEKTAGQEERRWERAQATQPDNEHSQSEWAAKLEEIKKARQKARSETEDWNQNRNKDSGSQNDDRTGRN